MSETRRRPDLYAAIAADQDAKQKAADEAAAPEREARERQAAADTKLFNTPAWDAIGVHRQRHATAYAARPVQVATEGGTGDAT